MNELDKWAADVCNILLIDTASEIKVNFFETDGKQCWFKSCWTLSDSRCMQVFREKFKISTQPYDEDMWEAGTYTEGELDSSVWVCGIGKTIPEAELACAKAIMEASK